VSLEARGKKVLMERDIIDINYSGISFIDPVIEEWFRNNIL